jgi:hypothetical protein
MARSGSARVQGTCGATRKPRQYYHNTQAESPPKKVKKLTLLESQPGSHSSILLSLLLGLCSLS